MSRGLAWDWARDWDWMGTAEEAAGGRHVKWQTPNPRHGARRNTHAYMDTFVPLVFVCLRSVRFGSVLLSLFICLVWLCLCLIIAIVIILIMIVSPASVLCVRGGECFLQCQQVDQDKGVPSPPALHSIPIPSPSPISNPLARHERGRGGNRLLQMPLTLRAKQIVTYKLCSEQTKPSNHPMND